MQKFTRVATFGAILAGLLASQVMAASGEGARYRTRQLIIHMNDAGMQRVQTARVNAAVPELQLPDGRALRFRRHFNGDALVVELPEELSLDAANRLAAELAAANPSVTAAYADKRMYPALVPDDPAYAPAFPTMGNPGQWYLFEDTAGIRMPAAWDRETGSAAMVVAVLDTGILAHRDIAAARVLPGYDFYNLVDQNSVSRDNDGEPGRDADPADPGDAVAADECGVGEPAEDSSWHGLSVTGVILAESDNTVDIAGIDFAAQLLPIRVLGKCGGSLADVAEAIRWAAGLSVSGVPMNPNPARVINLSLSGSGACSPAEQSAINAAVAAGAVVVTAAGNESGSVADVSPANCANVIVVGAIARDGSIASYVNTGSQVDLAAPGGEVSDGIVTLSNLGITMRAGDARGVITGTSFSTAQVSGVASLMLAANASLTPALVEEVLKATTRTFPDASCNDTLCGTGVLNADAALAGAADPSSVISQSVITSGGGGGGCVMRAGAAAGFDPLWLIGLILVALSRYRLIRRSR